MVYEVRKYDLIGKILYTSKEMPDLEKKGNDYYYKGTQDKYPHTYSRYWELTTSPPKDAFPHTDTLLPYFADVTEDVPGYLKRAMNPKTWKNCQLMVETHGSYLQFLHAPTDEVLRIAMNSNYYTPVN